MNTDIITLLLSLFLSQAFLTYLVYRSAMLRIWQAITISDTLFPQIPAIIHLAGIRPPRSYLSLSQYTPIDSRNVNKLGSIGTLMKFKGEPNACIYLFSENDIYPF